MDEGWDSLLTEESAEVHGIFQVASVPSWPPSHSEFVETGTGGITEPFEGLREELCGFVKPLGEERFRLSSEPVHIEHQEGLEILVADCARSPMLLEESRPSR